MTLTGETAYLYDWNEYTHILFYVYDIHESWHLTLCIDNKLKLSFFAPPQTF